MRRKNLFGRPIRRLKIFPVIAIFTLLLAGGLFAMRWWYQNDIDTLENRVFNLNLSIRAFRLPEIEAETMTIDALHQRLPYRQSAQDIQFNVRILMEDAPFTLNNFQNDVQLSTTAPLVSELGGVVDAWRVRSVFTTDDPDLAFRFVERLEAANNLYVISTVNVFAFELEGETQYEIEIVSFTYSIRGS